MAPWPVQGPSGRDHDSYNHLILGTNIFRKNTRIHQIIFINIILDISTFWKSEVLRRLEKTGTEQFRRWEKTGTDPEYGINIFQET